MVMPVDEETLAKLSSESMEINEDEHIDVVSPQFCKILHIPEKPPFLPHFQPTVDVHAAVIEPKDANTLIRKLNQIAPLEDLRHVKRVRKKCIDGGETQLTVLLTMAFGNDGKVGGMPHEVLELVKSYQFANMLQHQKKNGTNSASSGLLPIIHQPTTSVALLDLVKRSHNQFFLS